MPAELLHETGTPPAEDSLSTLKAELKTGVGTKATVTFGTGTSTVRVTAKKVGYGGNELSLEFADDFSHEAYPPPVLGVMVRGGKVRVTLKTSNKNVIESTAEQVIKAINESPAASALVKADNGEEGKETGAGLVAEHAAAFLSGGELTAECNAAVPAALQGTGQWRAIIDKEFLLVNAVAGAGKVLHIAERAIEGTSEAAHAVGATVNSMVTLAALGTYSVQRVGAVNAVALGVDNTGASDVGTTGREAIEKALIEGAKIVFPMGRYQGATGIDISQIAMLKGATVRNYEIECSAGAVFFGTAGNSTFLWNIAPGEAGQLLEWHVKLGVLEGNNTEIQLVTEQTFGNGFIHISTLKGLYKTGFLINEELAPAFIFGNNTITIPLTLGLAVGTGIKVLGGASAAGAEGNKFSLGDVNGLAIGIQCTGASARFNMFHIGAMEACTLGFDDKAGGNMAFSSYMSGNNEDAKLEGVRASYLRGNLLSSSVAMTKPQDIRDYSLFGQVTVEGIESGVGYTNNKSSAMEIHARGGEAPTGIRGALIKLGTSAQPIYTPLADSTPAENKWERTQVAWLKVKTENAKKPILLTGAKESGFTNEQRVRVTKGTGGGALVEGTVYWVVGEAANSFELATTKGGAGIEMKATEEAIEVALVKKLKCMGPLPEQATAAEKSKKLTVSTNSKERGFLNGTKVKVGKSAVAAFTEGTTYYVVGALVGNFELATTEGGAGIEAVEAGEVELTRLIQQKVKTETGKKTIKPAATTAKEKGFINGVRVRFIKVGGTGLSETTTYYVVGSLESSFEVATTLGGTGVTITETLETMEAVIIPFANGRRVKVRYAIGAKGANAGISESLAYWVVGEAFNGGVPELELATTESGEGLEMGTSVTEQTEVDTYREIVRVTSGSKSLEMPFAKLRLATNRRVVFTGGSGGGTAGGALVLGQTYYVREKSNVLFELVPTEPGATGTSITMKATEELYMWLLPQMRPEPPGILTFRLHPGESFTPEWKASGGTPTFSANYVN